MPRAPRLAAALTIALVAAGCAARKYPNYYVQIADALTAPTLAEGIRVVPRQFSTSELVAGCGDARPVERLVASPSPLQLRVGERFPLNTISVVSANSADVAIPDVPISLEAEETVPAVVQLRSDDPDLNEGRLSAIAPGSFRLRIRTICGAIPTAEVILNVLVSPTQEPTRTIPEFPRPFPQPRD